ncbi:MAG: hypothetical protein ACXIVG_09365 [Pararhodobacter sp.]
MWQARRFHRRLVCNPGCQGDNPLRLCAIRIAIKGQFRERQQDNRLDRQTPFNMVHRCRTPRLELRNLHQRQQRAPFARARIGFRRRWKICPRGAGSLTAYLPNPAL